MNVVKEQIYRSEKCLIQHKKDNRYGETQAK